MSTTIKAVLAVFYLVHILLFDEDSSGPFQSEHRFVYDPVTNRSRPVNLFDWVRRFVPGLGMYHIQQSDTTSNDELWSVRKDRVGVWSCPICLSFWVSFIITLPTLLFTKPRNLSTLAQALLSHFAIAGASSLLYSFMENHLGLPQMSISADDSDDYSF